MYWYHWLCDNLELDVFLRVMSFFHSFILKTRVLVDLQLIFSFIQRKATFSYLLIHKGSPQQLASHVWFGRFIFFYTSCPPDITPRGYVSFLGIKPGVICLLCDMWTTALSKHLIRNHKPVAVWFVWIWIADIYWVHVYVRQHRWYFYIMSILCMTPVVSFCCI